MKTLNTFVFPLMLLVASSVQATIFVEASQVGGITQFSISGSVNPLALTYRAGPFIGAASGTPAISPAWPKLGFGGNGSLNLNATHYNLPNLAGPAAFGYGSSFFNPDQHAGTNFIDINFDLGVISLDQYTANGATLHDTMAFTEPRSTYAQLGLTPGVYHWSWSNGSATDSLTLRIHPVPEPTTLTLAGLGGIAAMVVARRRHLAKRCSRGRVLKVD